MKYRRVRIHRARRRMRRAGIALVLFLAALFVAFRMKNRADEDSQAAPIAASRPQADKAAPAAVVPEPSTWVMLATGLALVSWQARRKLFHKGA